MRRSAILLSTNRKTVVRKMIVLGRYCEQLIYKKNHEFPQAEVIEFDDQETFEHSKLKPLSILAMVESGSRRILGWNVSIMPSKGLLAKKSRAKYGKRSDDRKENRNKLFKLLKPHIAANAVLKSDQNPHYGPAVREHFPYAEHLTYKGRRGCVVGQGELKAGGFDELFTLNHTFAMFRDNLKRLARKTWCTTKSLERLNLQIAMYVFYHNYRLIPQMEDSKFRSAVSGLFDRSFNN